MFDAKLERSKIVNGEYPSRIIVGRQNKHIAMTKEFVQKRDSMNRNNTEGQMRSEPAILTADAQTLVDNYKGTGTLFAHSGSTFPRELILRAVRPLALAMGIQGTPCSLVLHLR